MPLEGDYAARTADPGLAVFPDLETARLQWQQQLSAVRLQHAQRWRSFQQGVEPAPQTPPTANDDRLREEANQAPQHQDEKRLSEPNQEFQFGPNLTTAEVVLKHLRRPGAAAASVPNGQQSRRGLAEDLDDVATLCSRNSFRSTRPYADRPKD